MSGLFSFFEILYWFVWEEGFLWTLCKAKLCNKPNLYLLLLIVESLKGDTVTLLNSGIFIFGEYYLNLLNANVQKVARIKSSYHGKINPSKFKEEFWNVNELSGHKTNNLLIFNLLSCQCLKNGMIKNQNLICYFEIKKSNRNRYLPNGELKRPSLCVYSK